MAQLAEAGVGGLSLGERARRGMGLLFARQAVSQVVSLAGGIILARLLSPLQFGLFGIATTIVGTFGLISDFGLAPSFIQRKEELTEHDLQVGFTLQQPLIGLVVAGILLFAPWTVRTLFHGQEDSLWLVRVLAFSLFLSSWRTMSTLQLERHLKYDRLAWIEVAETVAFYGTVIALALLGWSIWSLVWATAIRSVLGTVLIFQAAPWPVRLAWDSVKAREILRFGVPFQVNVLVNSLGGWVAPTVVAAMVGPAGVGFLTWANSNGKKPLMMVESVMRVAFPHLSRLQDDPQSLAQVLVRYLTGLFLCAGLWMSLILVAGGPMVRWVYTATWEPAVGALCLASIAMMLDVVNWVLGVTLSSIGRVNVTSRAIAIRTVIAVCTVFPLVRWFGLEGAVLAHLLANLITVPMILNGFGSARGEIVRGVAWVAIPIVLSMSAGWGIRSMDLPTAWQAIVLASFTGLVFVGTAWVAAPAWLREAARRQMKMALTVETVSA